MNVASDAVNYIFEKAMDFLKRSDTMPERPPETLPKGAWGGTMDPIIQQQQQAQDRAIASTHATMQQAKSQESIQAAKEENEMLKRLQVENADLKRLQAENAELRFHEAVNEPPTIVEEIPPQPVSAVPMPMPEPKVVQAEPILKRRSPDFVAGQGLISVSQIRSMVDSGQLDTELMLELSRAAIELIYSINDALMKK